MGTRRDNGPTVARDGLLVPTPNLKQAKKALRAEFEEDTRRAESAMPGPDYYDVLRWVHAARRPATYFEIGVRYGQSMTLAAETARCVGVDPSPNLANPVPADTTILETTSNDFFRSGAARQHFGESGIDMAFIDGLHVAEQVVQDFVYTLPLMNEGGVVILHDVLPVRPELASRDRTTLMWLGDVWKAALAIRACFPDLVFRVVPTRPSGLLLVRVPSADARTQRAPLWDQLRTLLPRDYDDDGAREMAAIPRLANEQAAVTGFVTG